LIKSDDDLVDSTLDELHKSYGGNRFVASDKYIPVGPIQLRISDHSPNPARVEENSVNITIATPRTNRTRDKFGKTKDEIVIDPTGKTADEIKALVDDAVAKKQSEIMGEYQSELSKMSDDELIEEREYADSRGDDYKLPFVDEEILKRKARIETAQASVQPAADVARGEGEAEKAINTEDYDTRTIYYRGTKDEESQLKKSEGHEHFTSGVSTSPNKDYAASHGKVVRAYYGKKGKFADYFELMNEYEQETGNDSPTEEEISEYGKKKGYIGTVLNDPLAGVDYRFFEPSDLISVEKVEEARSQKPPVQETRTEEKREQGQAIALPTEAEGQGIALQEQPEVVSEMEIAPSVEPVQLTQEEEADYEQQWNTARGSVMDVDPNLSDAEADYAATLVQASNVSPEEAVRMTKESPEDVASFMAEEAVEEAPMAEEAVVEGEVAAGNVGKFLSPSEISVEVLDDAEYKNIVATEDGQQSESEGVFIAANKKIYINRDKVKGEWGKTIAYHEGTHPVVNIIRNTNPALYKAIVDGIMNAAKTNPNVARVVNMIKNNPEYKKAGQAVIEDETVVEVLAQIAAGKLDFGTFDKSTREKIIDFMNTLAEFFRLPKIAMNSPRVEVQNLAKKLTDALNKQGSIADVVGKKNVMRYENNVESLKTLSSPILSPTTISQASFERIIYGPKIEVNPKGHSLSFVKASDIIDIKSLIEEIAKKNEKVWFWTADQLGRGFYSDETVNGEHYLDAGPSWPLDPKNQNVQDGLDAIWASGANISTLEKNINDSDYIFIISGSPKKSKLFNRSVLDVFKNRIEKATGESWESFANTLIALNTKNGVAGPIAQILQKHDSYESIRNSIGDDRKRLLNALGEQTETKGTPIKKYLDEINLSLDVEGMRDGFYKDNGFDINDVMIVLKPVKVGGKSNHSTYENNILGRVVGVPDRRVNGIDLLPEERRKRFSEAQRKAPMTGAAGSLKTTIEAPAMGEGVAGQMSTGMRREAGPTVRKTSQGYQVISADGKPLSRPNLTEQQAKSMAQKIGRMTQAAPAVGEAITEIDSVLDQKGKNAAEARRNFKEKYGQDAYDRAREVTLNFDKIIESLEQEGRVRKDCP